MYLCAADVPACLLKQESGTGSGRQIHMAFRILIAPSGFKESLAADEVADCIARGFVERRIGRPVYLTKHRAHEASARVALMTTHASID